ncbi:MAG TPA: ATP-binding protein [Catalimonadaceae bacterium]|jgi:signal transduction histidine kinase|nr:ATP-binding protein [Catalimonadaceae bacterium]
MKQSVKIILSNRPLAIVMGGFLLTIATFIGNIFLTHDITQNLRTNVLRVENIYNEMALLAQIESELNFAENAMKNYFISKQVMYLRSHDRAISRLDKAFKSLVSGDSTGAISTQSLKTLTEHLSERQRMFKKAKSLIKSGRIEDIGEVKEILSESSDKTLEFRDMLQKLETDLKVSLSINRRYIDRSISYGSYTNYLAIGIAIMVAFFATLSITQDYLRQKRIEQVLRQLNDDKTKLFSILGHDLRSPLSGFNAIIYILKNHLSTLSEKDIREYVDQLEQTSQNYSKLLEDVLTWSRLQLNKIQITLEPIEIKLAVQEMIQLFQDQILQKKIQILNLIPSTLSIEIDRSMFQTTIRNLVSNAIKFSNSEGEIRIAHSEDKNYHFIHVEDNGVGMNESIIRTLFTNSTISMAGTENEIGTGLGLSICKEFLSKQGATILVSSKEGEGSIFSIQIPKNPNLSKTRSLKPAGV